jgi:hypothetical protein
MPVILTGAVVRFALYRQAVLITRALAIQFRGAQLCEAVRRESAQEVHEIVNLTRCKPRRFHLCVEDRISFPSFAEEFDDDGASPFAFSGSSAS